MGRAEEDTHRRVGEELDRIIGDIQAHHGRVFSFGGDGLMAEFPSTVEALKCALKIHSSAGKRNAGLRPDDRILFRVGLNVGEIVVQEDRAGGNTVNIAARLQELAEAGGIAMTQTAWNQVRNVVTAGYAYFREARLKNIRDPVSVYSIPSSECSAWLGMPALPPLMHQGDGSSAPEYRASLAILPFRSEQKDQTNAYFTEGIIDDIVFSLGAIKDFVVISRSSTQTFVGAPLDLRRIGHELDVRYVLHGSVRSIGGKLRIAVQLAEARSGLVIWIERFDGDLEDLFDLQDRIAVRVATSVAPHFANELELARALRKHPDSMTAYDIVLQATDLFHRADHGSLDRAGALLERAIAIDPNYGPAYSNLAAVRMRIFAQGWSLNPVGDNERAAELAREAIQLEPNDAVALAIYGHVQSYLRKDFKGARPYLDRALEAGPSCPLAWGYSSLTHGYVGDCNVAIKEAQHALRLSPLGPETPRYEHYLALAYYLAGQYEDAVAWARISLGRFPTNISNVLCLTVSYVAAGDLQSARVHARQLLALVPSFRLSGYRERTPLSKTVAEQAIDRLRLAGLPD